MNRADREPENLRRLAEDLMVAATDIAAVLERFGTKYEDDEGAAWNARQLAIVGPLYLRDVAGDVATLRRALAALKGATATRPPAVETRETVVRAIAEELLEIEGKTREEARMLVLMLHTMLDKATKPEHEASS